jgi:hypothetical protein
MSIELKIKSKHLSEEARIIRFEEKKFLKGYRWDINQHKSAGHNDPLKPYDSTNYRKFASLQHHRKWDVRNENRATFLARAYLAGVPYTKVEQKRKDEFHFLHYILPRICSMVVKYGPRIDGDWEWDRTNQKYAPTKQLRDKIKEWSKLNT